MVNAEDIRTAKSIGKFLRQIREEKGFNLAIVASQLKLTVMEVVSIENGNVLSKGVSSFMAVADQYAKEMNVDLNKFTVDQVKKVTTKELNIDIPAFLRKSNLQ